MSFSGSPLARCASEELQKRARRAAVLDAFGRSQAGGEDGPDRNDL
jgi:hypothetical protein